MTEGVLVTAIGSFAGDIVIKNLHLMGIRVIGCNMYPKEWIRESYEVDVFYQVSPCNEEAQYMDEIESICRKENVGFIIPLTDAEIDVLNRKRMRLSKNGVILCISPFESILICRDKIKSAEIIQSNNMKIKVIGNVEPDNISPEIKMPVICKPRNGRSSQGLRKIEDFDELQAFVRCTGCRNYMIQPEIKGVIVTVDIVRNRASKKCAVVMRKELLRTKNGAGTSVYIFKDEMLEEECMRLAALLDINGCVNFEFIETNEGEFYFLECNPRFSGGVEFSCIAGYDAVQNHMNCFTGLDIDAVGEIRSQYIVRKYEEYVTKIE